MTTSIDDTHLADLLGPDTVPGAVLLAGNGSGVLYEKAFGLSDVRSGAGLSTDALFQIMSMTKPVTSVGIMVLVERGQLSLDQAAADFLPWLAETQVIDRFNAADQSYSLRPMTGSITVRALLNHTAGFGYNFSSAAIRAFEADAGNVGLRPPALHEPGERWTYSLATGYLGDIIEAVSGQPLDRFLSEAIFEPLGMTDTSYFISEDAIPRAVAVHARRDGKLVVTDALPAGRPAGDYGLKSTAADYFKFLQMLLNRGYGNGQQILSGEAVAEMCSNQIGDLYVELQADVHEALSLPFPLGAGRDKFGLGFQIHDWDDTHKRGPGSFSWSGLYNTHFWVDPGAGIAGIALMQLLPFYDPACMQLMDAFERMVYTELV